MNLIAYFSALSKTYESWETEGTRKFFVQWIKFSSFPFDYLAADYKLRIFPCIAIKFSLDL